MKTKTKMKKILLLSMVFLAGMFLAGQVAICTAAESVDTSVANFEQVEQNATSSYSYTPMEKIPGFGAPADFPSYVMAVYKFGLWTIGISALLMITLGGYVYLTSAGNTSQTGKAKGIITDAIVGLILALVSWLLLYTIDPDLVKFSTTTSSGTTSESGSTTSTTGGTTTSGGTGTGTCSAVQSGDCSVANLQNTCFGSNATQASSICKAESNGTAVPSGTDKCSDGNSASMGLFQINLTNHNVGGLNCPSAFSGGAYTASNHNCTVTNKPLYDECVTAAKNSANNIAAACAISNNGANWGQWGANKTCGFNK